jgi:hypothetical protein
VYTYDDGCPMWDDIYAVYKGQGYRIDVRGPWPLVIRGLQVWDRDAEGRQFDEPVDALYWLLNGGGTGVRGYE